MVDYSQQIPTDAKPSNAAKKNSFSERFSNFKSISQYLSPALLFLTFFLMSFWSWRKWADPLIDFGRELYVPWQIVSGKILYEDIAHLFGPFSQYFNALLFKLFGVSYTTLVFANLVLTALFTAVVYHTIKNSIDKISAIFVAFVFLTLFAFSQYTGFANFNFICPYAHEATHGVILSAFMIYSLWKFTTTKRNELIITAGLCFGFIILTKIEVIIAATATIAVYFAIFFKYIETKRPFLLRTPTLFLVSTILPLVCFFIYFLSHIPVVGALKAVGGSFSAVTALDLANIPFYQISMGTYHFKASIYLMFKTLLFICIIIAIGLISALRFNSSRYIRIHQGVSFILLILMILLVWNMEWIQIGRPLPLFCFLIGSILFVNFRKTIRINKEVAIKSFPLILWSVFSLFLLIKIFFNTRFYHYGFYQAMPSFLLFVCFLTGYVPRWLTEKKFNGNAFRAFTIIFIGIIIVHYILLSTQIYRVKTFNVGYGNDRFYAFSPQINTHGLAVSHFLKWAKNLPIDATFTVLPEGVMMNYLARKTNPTKYINFMVPEMRVFGEDNILSDFIHKRPDFIVLVHKDTSEYGEDFFGRNLQYGKPIMDWVNQNYQSVVKIGDEPLKDNRFGIKVMKSRKSASLY